MNKPMNRNSQLQPAEAAGLMVVIAALVVLAVIAITASYFLGPQLVAIFTTGLVLGGWLIRKAGR